MDGWQNVEQLCEANGTHYNLKCASHVQRRSEDCAEECPLENVHQVSEWFTKVKGVHWLSVTSVTLSIILPKPSIIVKYIVRCKIGSATIVTFGCKVFMAGPKINMLLETAPLMPCQIYYFCLKIPFGHFMRIHVNYC